VVATRKVSFTYEGTPMKEAIPSDSGVKYLGINKLIVSTLLVV
jgi:hypothetical protein